MRSVNTLRFEVHTDDIVSTLDFDQEAFYRHVYDLKRNTMTELNCSDLFHIESDLVSAPSIVAVH